ncbi:YdbH domain-containing protein [Microvirga sp. SRT01]|uniref:YdbH domain-containing protein n=1 Tax=Sphingomonas longa TaxID=2778730 RepID=A0ABS2D552_9SPHN|nr:YdbH domain-containing protein [Microvirga sp. SRT01]MBM6576051.1 YdbH domain-containing protein [Sphingomonas sp. BT552]MBR7709097.1 YdbH domain-containing protein [Microvirga sp. SRT01]
MEDDNDAVPSLPIRRRSIRRRAAIALALVVVAGLILLWVERRPIAGRFVDRELAAAGVPATYTIADLGLGRQRLTDVVIGNPADPDLVADWIETRTEIGLSGVRLDGVRAGRVRMRGRLIDGRLSLGAIDRLLPAGPSGQPFTLPALDVEVADARLRLETPVGLLGLKIAGSGKLDDGFRGTVAAVAPTLAAGGCSVAGGTAAVRLTIDGGRPHIVGPVRAKAVDCRQARIAAPGANIDLTLSKGLDRWTGTARLATGATRGQGGVVQSIAGDLSFAGDATLTQGRLDVVATAMRHPGVTARRVTIAGDYGIGRRLAFQGRVAADGAVLAASLLPNVSGAGAGTPVAPLVRAVATAVARANRDMALSIDLAAATGAIRISRATLSSASGARMSLDGVVSADARGLTLNGTVATRGGGLPSARVSLMQAGPGAAIRGTARVERYAADGASLELTPVTFSATPGGATRIATTATLDGPLGDGEVEGLSLPLDVGWNGRTLVVGRGCAPLAWRALRISGLTLDPARLALCPTGPALVTVSSGQMSGGARLAASELTGRLGGTPLRVATGGATLGLADRGFTLTQVAARLGAPDRQTRIEAATLSGMIANGGVAGTFAGGGGKIGAVPLILSAADGRWALKGGVLDLTGALTVSDAQTDNPRFRPMQARGVALRLAGSAITATAMLHEPTTGTRVADLRIGHLLSSGMGSADLTVPDLSFREGFQPELLTPLTFGVVAEVRGNVRGAGHIAWDAQRVTSTGRFTTEALDLAVAFGPVTGLSGTIVFDDLLGLHTPAGQVALVKTVNPGIPVSDGTVRYQLLGGVRVGVEGARWPFAGGTLTLDPTVLDFDAARQRRMTFRVDGAGAGIFLQQFDFQNIDASGTFDGVLPMVFDQSGGRIENGRLSARPGGGSLAYVGTLSQQELGTWGNLAFQALKSLKYRSLSLVLNGPLTGEMVTDVRFAGISQGAGAKSNFLIRRLQKLPFVFNIRIKAPFRGLLDSAQSFYDPRRLIQRNLPALLEEQNKRAVPPSRPAATTPPVQTPESETMR